MIQGAARPQLPPLQPQPCALVMIAGGTGIRAATRSFLAVCLFSHTRTLSLLLSPSLSFSLSLSPSLSGVTPMLSHARDCRLLSQRYLLRNA